MIRVALGARSLTAVVGEGEALTEITVPLSLSADGAEPRAVLALAFEELRDRLQEAEAQGGSPPSSGRRGPGGEAMLTVALLPPLCETKLLRLPPLRPDEADEVLRRSAAQHFLTGGVPSVVAVGEAPRIPAPRSEQATANTQDALEPPTPPVMASAAPRALAEAIYEAVRSVGWHVGAIVPAHAAWATALRGRGEAKSASHGAPRVLCALIEGTAHVLRVEGDVVVAVRRVPASRSSDVVDAAGAAPGRVWVLAEPKGAAVLTEAFLTRGWHPGTASELGGTPARVAAVWADRAGMELVPPRLALERRDRVRRLGVRMGIAAAVLLVAAAGLQFWGNTRELAQVRERRAEIREAVTPVLAAADELAGIEDRLAGIDEIRGASGAWTFTLVELAMVLPESVHLVSLQAAGDTLVIDAVGQRAGDALDALRRAESLRDVRQEGVTQYEVEDGTVARERFTLSAIRVPEASSTAAPDVRGGAL